MVSFAQRVSEGSAILRRQVRESSFFQRTAIQFCILGTTNGLPSDDIHAVAFLNGKLYIGAGETDRGGYIVSYES